MDIAQLNKFLLFKFFPLQIVFTRSLIIFWVNEMTELELQLLVAPFRLTFGRGFSTPIPRLRLSVNLSEAARGEISLRPCYASGGSLRAILLENWTTVNR